MSCLFPGMRQRSQTQTQTQSTKSAEIAESDDVWSTVKHMDSKPSDSKLIAAAAANTCPECLTDAHLVTEEEEVLCLKCGISLGYEIDSTAEYRWFGADDRNPDPTRVGNPLNPLLPESSMGTRILVRPGENRAMRKIRQYHLWNVMPYRERTLWNVFEMLQVRAANAGISSAILEETKQLYAQVSPLCICRGQQKDALMAACLFESLKRHDTPRRPTEIAEIFKINLKLITRGVKQFSGLLDEHLHAMAKKDVAAATAAATAATSVCAAAATATDETTTEQTVSSVAVTSEKDADASLKPVVVVNAILTPSTSFRHYLEPAILRMETPRALLTPIMNYACLFGNMLDELGICPETTPPSLAACSLSLACQKLGLVKGNSEISGVCGISMATLQKCMKRIEPWKNVLFRESPQ